MRMEDRSRTVVRMEIDLVAYDRSEQEVKNWAEKLMSGVLEDVVFHEGAFIERRKVKTISHIDMGE